MAISVLHQMQNASNHNKNILLKNVSLKNGGRYKLLARKLNLVYNINGQQYANMLKFFRGIFWEAAFFSEKLIRRVQNIFNRYLVSKQEMDIAVTIK